MSAPNTLVLPEELDSLSVPAKAVGGCLLGLMKPGQDGGLTFHLVESRPSPKTQDALDELVAAGVAEKIVSRSGAHTYRPLVDCFPLHRWMMRNHDNPEVSFPITEPIAPKAPTRTVR